MKMIPELKVIELAEDTCCGMAGTFGLKKQFYDLSMKAGFNLFTQIRESDVDSVITTCGTCNMQIEHATGLRVEHLAGILLESYLSYRHDRPSTADTIRRGSASPTGDSNTSDMVIE